MKLKIKLENYKIKKIDSNKYKISGKCLLKKLINKKSKMNLVQKRKCSNILKIKKENMIYFNLLIFMAKNIKCFIWII